MSKLLKHIIVPVCCIIMPFISSAQKPFVEGAIEYSVKLQPADGSAGGAHNGTYLITVKGKQVKKEFKLDNNYDNSILCNGDANGFYSLKSSQGKKYAIQLDEQEMLGRSAKYTGFRLDDQGNGNTIAGLAAQKAKVSYKDGSSMDILYSKEWKPADEHLFERFPGINGLPLDFTYKTENGATIHFHAEKVQPGIIENAVFRLPKDIKVISNTEYQQLTKQ